MAPLILAFALLMGCSDAAKITADAPISRPSAEMPAPAAAPTLYTYDVVATYPHGTDAFIQGLFFHDGVLYETTGQYGASRIIRHSLFGDADGATVKLPDNLFGEGAAAIGDRIYSLTWRAGLGFVRDLETLSPIGKFEYSGEGWGLTHDGTRIIVSDGTNRLRFFDPETFEQQGSVAVMANGRPVPRLNELEYIDGEVWANIWQTDVIARISPDTGTVVGFVNMSGLHPNRDDPREQVLNGIAYDPESGRLLVTGKEWPTFYEVVIKPVR